MKKRHGISRTILIAFIIFILMLAVNAAVMRLFFNINALDVSYVKTFMSKGGGNIDGQRQISGAGRNGDLSENNRQVYWNAAGTENREDARPGCGDAAAAACGDGSGPAAFNGNADESGYFILPEEIESLKHLSLQDKLFALSVISKIDRDVKDRIYEMSKDGVTYSEFAEIRESVGNYLEPDDMESLEEIFLRNRSAYAGSGR
jgi:hypothetical protein